jgi:hypothetical protein
MTFRKRIGAGQGPGAKPGSDEVSEATGEAAAGDAAGSTVVGFRTRPEPREVTFDRHELGEIFGIYGRMVAAGEWRDYAIDHLCDRAVFSVFRRTAEAAHWRIEKIPRLAQRQGAYGVVDHGGRIVARGHELKRVLAVLEKTPRLVGR